MASPGPQQRHYERRPLLSDPAPDSPTIQQPQPQDHEDQGPSRSRFVRVVIVGFFINMMVDIYVSFNSLGLTQMIEGAACQQLYPNVTQPYKDQRCKADDVEARLATITGWQNTFMMLPGLVTAMPWGLFADRYGARALLFVAFLGNIGFNLAQMGVALNPFTFDLRYIWLCSLFYLVGGGIVSYEAMQYTVANSISTESNRATIFFYLTVLQIVNQLFTGPLAYAAMNVGPVFTQSIAVAALVGALLLVLALPGDISTSGKKDKPQDEAVAEAAPGPSGVLKQASSVFQRLFRDNVQLGLLLFSLLFTMIGAYENIIRLQYSTKRYGYTWGEAGLVNSITTVVNLVLITVLLPVTSKWLLRTRSAVGKDIWLARCGLAALVVGSFATGLAPTRATFIIAVLIFRMSSAYPPTIISLIASVAGIRCVDDEHASLVYLAVAFMRCAGQLIAGPLLAVFLTLGIEWGGAWLGLPFVLAGFLQILAGCIVFSVKDKTKAAGGDGDVTERDNEEER